METLSVVGRSREECVCFSDGLKHKDGCLIVMKKKEKMKKK